jgi:hypothetical protein
MVFSVILMEEVLPVALAVIIPLTALELIPYEIKFWMVLPDIVVVIGVIEKIIPLATELAFVVVVEPARMLFAVLLPIVLPEMVNAVATPEMVVAYK